MTITQEKLFEITSSKSGIIKIKNKQTNLISDIWIKMLKISQMHVVYEFSTFSSHLITEIVIEIMLILIIRKTIIWFYYLQKYRLTM